MEDVKMIFKAKHWSIRKRVWCDNAGNNTAAFFFRGEAPRHGIKAVWIEPFFRLGVKLNCIAALYAVFRPLRGMPNEMAKIEPWYGSLSRPRPNVLLQSEIHDGASRYTDTVLT